jgi:hypothetical protein
LENNFKNPENRKKKQQKLRAVILHPKTSEESVQRLLLWFLTLIYLVQELYVLLFLTRPHHFPSFF